MTTTLSTIYTTSAPAFRGIWLHAPAAVSATERHFFYGNVDRIETISVDRTLLRFVGRPKPVAEYGENEDEVVGLSTLIPYDADHDEAVQWWRDQIRARRTLLYRDNRGRKHYVSLDEALISDLPEGSIVSCSVTEVDFSEAV